MIEFRNVQKTYDTGTKNLETFKKLMIQVQKL